MLKQKIAIIGVGNMGGAIASALLEKEVVSPTQLVLSNRGDGALRKFARKGVVVTADNCVAVESADMVVLAVKPQVFSPLLSEIAAVVSEKQLVISIVAGIEVKFIKKILGDSQPVV